MNTTRKPTQYFGVCDVHTPEGVRQILNARPNLLTSIKLQVGVMTSRAIVQGKPDPFSDIWLPLEQIATPFIDDGRVMNTIHIVDFSGEDVYPTIRTSVQYGVEYGGDRFHGIQLDMKWPNPISIAHAVLKYQRPFQVILQIGREAMQEVNFDARALVAKLMDYQRHQDYPPILTHVLLDMSMGEGRPLAADVLNPFISEIHHELPELGIAVGGGLGPDTLDLVEPLIAQHSFLSTDAQAELHDNRQVHEPVNVQRACDYIKGMHQMHSLKHPFLF